MIIQDIEKHSVSTPIESVDNMLMGKFLDLDKGVDVMYTVEKKNSVLNLLRTQ